MNTFSTSQTEPFASTQPLLKPLIDVTKRWLSAFETTHIHRQAARQLNALDDRLLRDIGIDRSEIDAAVRGQLSTSRAHTQCALRPSSEPVIAQGDSRSVKHRRLVAPTFAALAVAAIMFPMIGSAHATDPSKGRLELQEQRAKVARYDRCARFTLNNFNVCLRRAGVNQSQIRQCRRTYRDYMKLCRKHLS